MPSKAQTTSLDPSEIASSASSKTVFLTGATGYIGGTILTKLLAFPHPPKSLTCLVRDPAKVQAVKDFSTSGTTVQGVQGSLSDHDVLEKEAAAADITVSCADADDLPALQAILKGMKSRREKTGHRPLLVHTSGTGVLVDNAKGEYPSDKIYTDYAPAPPTRTEPALLGIDTLADNAPHRSVDLEIVKADAAGWCKSYIILPSTIWGAGTGEVFDKGFANSFSQQVPTLCRIALDRGVAGMVGKGANIWPHVEINDLGDLYARVYNGAIKGDIGHGANGYYFGVSGEYTLLAAAEALGSALVDNKWSTNAQPTTLKPEEMEKYYQGSYFMGTNSRARAVRSKSIGWRPKYDSLEDFIRHAKQELVRVEKKYGKEWKA